LFLRILRYTSIHESPLLYGILTFHAINKTSILYMFHVKHLRKATGFMMLIRRKFKPHF